MQRPAGAPHGAVLLVGTLAAIYLVSQFLRNSVGVIAPDLAREIGLNAAEIGLLSSAFLLRLRGRTNPARHRARPLRAEALHAAVRSHRVSRHARLCGCDHAGRSRDGTHSDGARFVLLLMAPLALYARRFPPERFTLLAGIQIGIGTVGTLFVTAPLAWASAAIGWRATFLVVAGLSSWRDPRRDRGARRCRRPDRVRQAETLRESLRGVLEVARMPSFCRSS
jgi:hypothetical protein